MFSQTTFLAATSTANWVADYAQWIIAGIVVVACLGFYGGMDLLRFSIGRTRAVASVCFAESIRKRILWLTPLAILGVVLIAQFQRPLDVQDSIRQTTKFCIFASGLLVTVAAVILACTNLPKEIDNRVIYTVVTKPISRLEILLGKVVGFACVSASILLIMGVFTWGYLHLRAWALAGEIQSRLQVGGMELPERRTLEYYAANGLLDARSYVQSNQIMAYAEYARLDAPQHLMAGDGEQEAMFPFVLDAAPLPASFSPGGVGMMIELHIPWQKRTLTAEEEKQVSTLADQAGLGGAKEVMGPMLPSLPAIQTHPAFVRVDITDSEGMALTGKNGINDGKPITLPDATGRQAVNIPIASDAMPLLARIGRFYIQVAGMGPGTQYILKDDAVRLIFPATPNSRPFVLSARQFDSRRLATVVVQGRSGMSGQQLRGDASEKAPVGVFAFRQAILPVTSSGEVMFEYRGGIERSGDSREDTEQYTRGEFRVLNIGSGKLSPVISVPLESRRSAHFNVASEFVTGGDFDVQVRCASTGNWLGLRNNTLQIVSANHGFTLNLGKSLLILWLFSILVVVVSIFCSTFLSWPIAVVLTLLILLGHWGVMQLSDVMTPGVGRQIVNDLFTGAAPPVAETINRSLEALTSMLRGMSLILPDISRFAAMEDMEQGVAISTLRLLESLGVLVVFGLPVLAISYVFFRNKEVAP